MTFYNVNSVKIEDLEKLLIVQSSSISSHTAAFSNTEEIEGNDVEEIESNAVVGVNKEESFEVHSDSNDIDEDKVDTHSYKYNHNIEINGEGGGIDDNFVKEPSFALEKEETFISIGRKDLTFLTLSRSNTTITNNASTPLVDGIEEDIVATDSSFQLHSELTDVPENTATDTDNFDEVVAMLNRLKVKFGDLKYIQSGADNNKLLRYRIHLRRIQDFIARSRSQQAERFIVMKEVMECYQQSLQEYLQDDVQLTQVKELVSKYEICHHDSSEDEGIVLETDVDTGSVRQQYSTWERAFECIPMAD